MSQTLNTESDDISKFPGLLSTFDGANGGDHLTLNSLDTRVVKEGYLIKKRSGGRGRNNDRDQTVYMVLSTEQLKIFRSKIDYEDNRGILCKYSLDMVA